MDLLPIYGALAALLAGLYLVRVTDPPGRTRTMLKTLSVLVLALVALIGGAYLLLVLALVCCAAGDALLSRPGDGALKAGMAAFGAGHLVYIVLFANQGGGVGMDAVRILFQIATLGACVMISRWLWPDLGALRTPVAIYMALVTLTALLALGLPNSLWPVTIGALMLLTSDALLAGELFKLTPDSPTRAWSSPAIWLLYWGGQAAITAGFLYPHR